MAYGSVLAGVTNFSVATADGIRQEIKNNLVSRTAIKLLGIPHIGMRMRARVILKLLRADKSDVILDAGCGMGLCLLTLGERIGRGYGVDIDIPKVEEAARLARELGVDNITFRVADAVQLDFPEEFFDKIICSEVLEHVKDDRRLIKEFLRMLKKRGILVISTTSMAEINQRYKEKFGHERVGYSVERLRSLFEGSGLSIEEILPYGLFFGQKSWKMNRSFLLRKFINALCFYPLLGFTLLDNFLPRNLKNNCIGYIVKLRKA